MPLRAWSSLPPAAVARALLTIAADPLGLAWMRLAFLHRRRSVHRPQIRR
jgi:hypothetical protein